MAWVHHLFSLPRTLCTKCVDRRIEVGRKAVEEWDGAHPKRVLPEEGMPSLRPGRGE